MDFGRLLVTKRPLRGGNAITECKVLGLKATGEIPGLAYDLLGTILREFRCSDEPC